MGFGNSIFLALAVFILSACAINKNVTPVQDSAIDVLCIERNDQVLMANFEPTLGRLIEERGMVVRPFSGARPDDCRYMAKYVANWRWDMAMYLYYARIEVFEDSRSIGLAEYDAALGGLNMGKFGSTEGKLRPLVERLFVRT